MRHIQKAYSKKKKKKKKIKENLPTYFEMFSKKI